MCDGSVGKESMKTLRRKTVAGDVRRDKFGEWIQRHACKHEVFLQL